MTKIEKLEKQIELLKCCGNCDHEDMDYEDNACIYYSNCSMPWANVGDRISYWQNKKMEAIDE